MDFEALYWEVLDKMIKDLRADGYVGIAAEEALEAILKPKGGYTYGTYPMVVVALSRLAREKRQPQPCRQSQPKPKFPKELRKAVGVV